VGCFSLFTEQLRSFMNKSRSFNLLTIKPIRALILWSGFPYVFQAITVVMFLWLAWFGWGMFPPDAIPDKLYARTNIVNLVIWGIWWPLMIWIAVLFGRAWCMVCPLELVSNTAERLSRFFKVPQRSIGKWLRSGMLMVIFYAALQMLVAGVHLHRIPAYTSIFMLSLVALAGVTGFFFKDRAFCRAFCPVGMLLNAYGRGGMLAIRAGSGSVCQGCTGKDCITACNRNKLDARSCPSLLNPPKLNSNKDCLVCGQCIKSCQPDNMQLLLRLPFSKNDARESHASWALTIFIMLASGFVTSELCSEWAVAQHIFLTVPESVSQSHGLEHYAGWIEAVWTLFVVPLVVWSLLGGVVSLFNKNFDIFDTWKRLALPMAVIISVGHMSKALAKFTSWVSYLPLALSEPEGINAASSLALHSIASPSPILNLHIVGIISLGLIVTGIVFAVREAQIANPNLKHYHVIPKFVYATLFLSIVYGWL